MTREGSLFADDQPAAPAAQVQSATRGDVIDWQVAQIRKAFSRLRVDDMLQRQRTIEDLVRRSVAHIRHLHFSEAQALLEHLSDQAPPSQGGSAWDNRDGDTWIDRL